MAPKETWFLTLSYIILYVSFIFFITKLELYPTVKFESCDFFYLILPKSFPHVNAIPKYDLNCCIIYHQAITANTLFQKHTRRLYTWTSPDGNTEIRLIVFFAAKDEEALYSQQKQDQELTVAQIMNSLLPNSDSNWIENSTENR